MLLQTRVKTSFPARSDIIWVCRDDSRDWQALFRADTAAWRAKVAIRRASARANVVANTNLGPSSSVWDNELRSNMPHFDDAIAALSVKLEPAELESLEERTSRIRYWGIRRSLKKFYHRVASRIIITRIETWTQVSQYRRGVTVDALERHTDRLCRTAFNDCG